MNTYVLSPVCSPLTRGFIIYNFLSSAFDLHSGCRTSVCKNATYHGEGILERHGVFPHQVVEDNGGRPAHTGDAVYINPPTVRNGFVDKTIRRVEMLRDVYTRFVRNGDMEVNFPRHVASLRCNIDDVCNAGILRLVERVEKLSWKRETSEKSRQRNATMHG